MANYNKLPKFIRFCANIFSEQFITTPSSSIFDIVYSDYALRKSNSSYTSE